MWINDCSMPPPNIASPKSLTIATIVSSREFGSDGVAVDLAERRAVVKVFCLPRHILLGCWSVTMMRRQGRVQHARSEAPFNPAAMLRGVFDSFRFPAGETLFREGDEGNRMYVILEG